jgi:hypothetical protein
MRRTAFSVLALSAALLSLPALAQDSAAAAVGLGGCGDPTVKFNVKQSSGQDPAQPEAGKALVFFIEKDTNLGDLTAPTTKAGIDGKWMGATHGESHFYFSVDPGVHHLCAITQFGWPQGGAETALAHFTAEAGGVYYFEVKTIVYRWNAYQSSEASLFPLDSDEGLYLTTMTSPVTSRVKK